ncbi:conserved hypothetical protein [Rhodobacteraceae bacterium KLH11]|nr:conserved hypothetical protein [Rhodobacteraceae bacterium KLH11]
MFKPDDPLKPLRPQFLEGWHAQALALADTLVTNGAITAQEWANTLGAALDEAERSGAPDTEDTYYNAVVQALETVTVTGTDIKHAEIKNRKKAWTEAYLSTPHGQPVVLRTGG